MPIVDPDVLTVSCRGSLAGAEQWANVFHVIGSGTPLGATEAGDIATCFFDFYTELKTQNLWDQWSHDTIEVKQESSGLSFESAGIGAGAASNGMPPDVAVVLSWRTAVNSRRGRGRTYICGLIEGHNDEGLLSTVVQGAWLGAGKVLATDLIAAGAQLAVYSATAGIANAVTAIRVGRKFDSQRRRDNRLSESYLTDPIP